MPKQYEVPQLTLIGQANSVVLGTPIGGLDNGNQSAPDFEFEHDLPLI